MNQLMRVNQMEYMMINNPFDSFRVFIQIVKDNFAGRKEGIEPPDAVTDILFSVADQLDELDVTPLEAPVTTEALMNFADALANEGGFYE